MDSDSLPDMAWTHSKFSSGSYARQLPALAASSAVGPISSGLNLSAQVITESIRTLVSNSVALSEEPIIHGETYASNSASTAMNKYLEWIRYKEPMDVNNNSSAGSSRSFVLVENTLIAQGNSTDSSNRVAEQVLSDSPTVLDSNVVADLTSVHGGECQQPVVLTGALSAAEHELSMEISQNAFLKKKKNMLQSPRKRRRCTRTDTPASEVNVMWRRQSSRLVNQRVKKELTEASSIDNCAAALSGNEGPWKRQSDVALGENWSLTVINDTRPEECEAKSKSVMARQEAETKIGEGSTMTEVMMAESVPQKTYMNVGRAAKGNVRVCSEVAKDDMKEVANENLTVCIPTNGQSNSENLDCYSVAGYCENFQTMDIDNNSCAGFSGLLAIVENTLTSQGNITEGSSQVVEQVLSDSPTVSDSNVVADFTSVHSGECQQPVVGTSPVAQKCVTDMEASPKKSEPYLKTRGEDIEARPMMLTGGLDEPEAELSMEVSQSVPSKKRKMMRQSPRKRRRCTRTDTPASEVNVMWRRQSSRLVNQRVKKELTEASSIDNCAAAFLGNEEQWKRQSDVASGSDWSLTVINDTRPEECEVKSKSVMARQEAETKIDEGSTMTEIMMAESVSRKTYMNVGNAAKRNVNVCSGMATDELEQVQHESSTVCILKKDHCRKDNLTVIDETARQVVGMSEAEDDQICELDPRQLDCVFYVRGMYGDESSDKLPDGPPRCSDVCDSYVEWVPIAHQEGSQLPMLSASVKCAKLPQQVQRSDEGASKHGRAGNLGEGIEPEGNSVLSSPSLPVPDGGISEWRYQVNTLIEDCGIADQSCLDVAQRATVGKLFDYETEEFSSQEDVVAPDISTTELLPNELNLVSTVSVGPDVDLTSANLIGCPEITSEEGDAVHLEQHHVDGGREGSENPLMMHTVEAFTSDKIKSLFNDANSMCMEANEQGDWLFSRQDVSAHHTDTIELTPEEVSSVGANSSELVNLQRSLSQDYNDFDSSCPLANSKINPDSCDWEITDDNSTCHEKHGVYILDDDQTDQSSLVSSFSETMNLLMSLTENSIQTRDATHALFFSESEVARNPLSQGVPIESSHEGHHVNTRYVFCAQDIDSAVETAYRRPPHPVLSTVAMVTCQDLEQPDAATVTMSPSQDTEHCDVSSVTMLTSQDTEQSDVTNVTVLTSHDTEQSDVSSVNKLTSQGTEQPNVTTVAMLTSQDTEQSDVFSVNKLISQDTEMADVTTVTMLTSQDTEQPDVSSVNKLTSQDTEQSDVTTVTMLSPQDTEQSDVTTVTMLSSQDTEQSDVSSVTMLTSQETEQSDVSSVTMLTSQETEQSDVTTVAMLTYQDTEQSDVTTVAMLTSQDTEQPDVTTVTMLTPQDTEQSDVTTVAMLTYQDTEQSDVSSVNKLTPQDTGQPNGTTVTMLTSQDTEKSDVTTVTMLTPQDKEQSDVTGVTKLISQDTEMPDVTTVTMLTSQDTEQSHVSSVNKLTSQDTEQPNMSPVTSFTSKPLQQSNIDCISIVTSEFQEQPDTASMRIFASQDREESGSVCFSRDGSQCLTESSTSSCHCSSLVWSPSVVSTIRGTLHRDILTEHNDVSFIKGSEVCDAVAKGESLHLGSYGALEKSVNDEMERESERESSISDSRREEVTSPECIQVQQQEDDASDSISEETNTAEVPDFKRVLAASQIGVHDGGHCGVSLPLRDSALNRVTENNSDGEPLGNTHFLCERVDEGSVWLTPRGDINHAAGHNSDTWWSFASSSVCSTGLVVDQKNSLMGCNTDQSHIQHVIPTRGTDLNHDIALGNIINVESGLNTLPMDKQKDIMLSLWEGEGNKSHIENGEEASTCVTATRSTMGETNSEIVKYDAKGTVTTDKVEESSISQSMLKQLPLPTTSPALSDIIYASEYAEGGVAKWYSVNLCHHDLTDTSDDCKAAHERGCEQVDSCNVVRQLSFDQEESAGSVCDTTQDSLSDVTPSEVLLIQASCESGAQNVPVGSDEATVSGSADVTCQKSKSAGRDSRTVTRPGNKAPLFTPKKSTQPNEMKCNKRSVDDIVLPLAKRRYSSLDMNPPCTPCAVSTPFSDPSNLNDVEPGDYLMEMVESPRRITRAMLAAARPKLVTKSPCISHKHVSVAAATGVRSRSEDTTTLAPSVAKVGSPAKSLSPSASIRPLSPHWIRSTSSSIESDVESTVSPKACLAPNTIATPPKNISEQMSASALRYKGVESSSAHVPPSTPANINVGAFIWAKLGSHPWWPALVVSHRDCAQCPARFNSTWVYWFGDHNVSEMPCYKLSDFVSDFQFKYSRTIKRHYHQSIDEILQACKLRVTSPDTTLDEDNLIEWAEGSFGGLDSSSFDPPSGSMAVPASVQPYLTLVREKADDSRGRCTESAKDECMTEEDIQLLERIRNGDMSIEDICISCCQGEVMLVDQHPLFHGGVCQACKEELLETLLAHGDDSANVYCVVCGYAGELYVCDNFECSRVYCLSCIEVLIGDAHAETVRSASPWSCFMCEDVQEGLLHPRSDWQQRLVKFFQVETHVMGEIDPSCFVEKRPIRVLSLFDGIGTGKFALDQLGLEVETYFASEVDQDAVNVVSIHYGNKVQQIGDISSIPSCKIASLCPIDLLIGGSPCNDLSLVNPSRKGIYGGSGVLFFEFYRILKCIQQSNPSNRHLFWLYENVVTMPADCKATISKFLECEPAMWDAQLFSAQKRARYFWGNIPGLYSHAPLHVEERGEASSISEILTSSCNRKAVVKKVRTITTRPNSLRQGKQEKLFPVQMNGVGDTLWSTELERLFGFPDHYTDVGNLSVGQRQKLLGKAWSVPVIHHLLKPIAKFYMSTEQSDIMATSDTAMEQQSSDISVPTSSGNSVLSPLSNTAVAAASTYEVEKPPTDSL